MKKNSRDHLLAVILRAMWVNDNRLARQRLLCIGEGLVLEYKNLKRRKIEKEIDEITNTVLPS